jgi:hypothetical protein
MGPDRLGEELDDLKEKLPPETTEEVEPAPPENAEEPSAPEDAEPADSKQGEKPVGAEEEWIEEYERETEQVKPKRPRHLGGIIITVAIILFMVIWTVLSPAVLPQAGTTYLDSDRYANLGDYTGDRDIWWLGNSVHVGSMTWGVSMSGEQNVSANETATFDILVTKVTEEPGSFWFRGTAVKLKNVSLYLDDGTYLGSMTNQTKLGFGPLATVSVEFPDPGSQDLQVFISFTVYTIMRIGYLPLETVEITADFDVAINVASQHS